MPHPSAEEARTYEDQLQAIATASGFRTRTVALRGDWFREDHGSLLGQMANTSAAGRAPADQAAAVRTGRIRRPASGSRSRPRTWTSSASFAFAFYRPFPDGPVSAKTLLKFGFQGMGPDLRWVLLMAMIVGMCGTVTPYFTGKIFDEAVPQADRSGAHRLRPRDARVRVRHGRVQVRPGCRDAPHPTRMGSSIQAAVWDRILNLPVNFFRKYSAGDLADRAGRRRRDPGADLGRGRLGDSGIDQRVVLRRPDVHATTCGWRWSRSLLTITYVAVNMIANYLQLRYQRSEMQVRGAISRAGAQPAHRRLEAAHLRLRAARLPRLGREVSRSSAGSASRSARSRTLPACSRRRSRSCRTC